MEISRLEELTANSMDGGAEVRMRSSAAEAKQIRSELDLELERAKEEVRQMRPFIVHFPLSLRANEVLADRVRGAHEGAGSRAAQEERGFGPGKAEEGGRGGQEEGRGDHGEEGESG